MLVSALERANSIDRSLYTEESLALLDQVIENVQEIISDENVAQADVNNAVELIEKSINQLEVIEIPGETEV